jgi:tRNA (cytidine32/uridine32-2'-O)-methyltransferase
MQNNIRIVLLETTHPGNIGAVARAMLTMNLHELILVQPRCDPYSPIAMARASGAHSLLTNAKIVPDLQTAVADCHCVIGSSARQRDTLWEAMDPQACARYLQDQTSYGPVALIFGRESSGLTREELDQCSHLVHIPANPDYSSLNIAMAVQVLAYELRMTTLQATITPGKDHTKTLNPQDQPATSQQKQGFFTHLETTLREINFLQPGQEQSTLRRLERLFQRATPAQREIQMLRGVLSAVQQHSSSNKSVSNLDS